MRTPCPDPFNLADYVLAAGKQVPDKCALQIVSATGSESWTYRDLRQAVFGTATGLLQSGLRPGDRLLLRLGNTADFPICFLAAIYAGIVPIPTSAQLGVAEITKIADMCQPHMIAAAPGIAVPDHPNVLSFETLQAMRRLPHSAPELGDPNRPAYIIFTSGTSGTARGVVHAHRAIWARRMMCEGWYGLTAGDRMMHAGAFNWTYTLGTGLLDPWAIGATALIPQAGTPSGALPALMAAHNPTIFAAAPGIYRQMLRHPMPPLPDLRHGLSAGEKLPESTRDRWRQATGTDIHEAFGMSECSTFISGSPSSPSPTGTLGKPQDGRLVTLRDGQIAIHRNDPGLMLGYLNDAAETQAKIDGDWFLTGDLAEEAKDGALRYLGRSDDMMNAGGFRVSPLEVEIALTLHPNLTEAAACEVRIAPDKTLIAGFYSGTATPEAELHRHCAAHLAGYKRPHLFIWLDTLPRGANNKLNRRTLRQQWERDHGQT